MAKRVQLGCAGAGNIFQAYNEWITEINPEVVLYVRPTIRMKTFPKAMKERSRQLLSAYSRKYQRSVIRFVPHPYSGIQNSLCVWKADSQKWWMLAFGSGQNEIYRYPITFWYDEDPKAFTKLLKSERAQNVIFDTIKRRSR